MRVTSPIHRGIDIFVMICDRIKIAADALTQRNAFGRQFYRISFVFELDDLIDRDGKIIVPAVELVIDITESHRYAIHSVTGFVCQMNQSVHIFVRENIVLSNIFLALLYNKFKIIQSQTGIDLQTNINLFRSERSNRYVLITSLTFVTASSSSSMTIPSMHSAISSRETVSSDGILFWACLCLYLLTDIFLVIFDKKRCNMLGLAGGILFYVARYVSFIHSSPSNLSFRIL